jgi:predicted amidophosphoribosyltransferase
MGVNSSTAWLLAGALSVVLIATGLLVWMVFRRRTYAQPAMRASAPLVCPTCRRGYPSGTQYCPVDAARLIPTYEGAAGLPPGRGGKCPRCRRAFEVGVRFCPMDAEELVPLATFAQQQAEGASAAGGIQTEAYADYLVGGSGKICPVCASKYDLAAGYCGRDASELVTVN